MIKRFGSEGPTQFQPPAEGWLTPTSQAAPPGTAVKASVGGPKEERRGGTRAAQRHCARRRCCLGERRQLRSGARLGLRAAGRSPSSRSEGRLTSHKDNTRPRYSPESEATVRGSHRDSILPERQKANLQINSCNVLHSCRR